MVPTSSLLSAARAFIRKSAGTAALVVAPLAAVQLATATARAQTAVFLAPVSGGTAFTNATSGGLAFTSGFTKFNYALATGGNDVAGRGFGASVVFNGDTTSSFSQGFLNSVTFAGSGTNTLPAGAIPINYDFTLAVSGAAVFSTWQLQIKTDADGSFVTLASGSSAGHITGSTNYNVASPTTFTSYQLKLLANFALANNQVGDLTLTMDGSASQGIALNGALVAIPEPATAATLLATTALAVAFLRRSRRRAAA